MSEIPKIIHQIHLGDSELSLQQKEWQKTWIHYNPDWKYILWNDNEISKLNITNSKQLANCKNFSEKSDILRFEILYQFGGLYIDTDFECLKNIDQLFNQYSDKDLIIFLESKNEIGSSFIATIKQNKLIKKLIDDIPVREQNHLNSPSNIKYGPTFISDTLGVSIAISESKMVYPYLWNKKHKIKKEHIKTTHPESYAVHHWLHSWKT
jgi:mannosyltransferase OCH1-like enzyme